MKKFKLTRFDEIIASGFYVSTQLHPVNGELILIYIDKNGMFNTIFIKQNNDKIEFL